MAKGNGNNAAKVNVEALMKEAQAFQQKAQDGIDALLIEQKEIRAEAERRVELLQEQIETLNNLYHAATGRYYVASPSKKGSGKAEGDSGRKRRTADELKADAEALADAIKAAGKEGAKAGDLKAIAKPQAGMNFKEFIEKYSDYKIKVTGDKATTRYFIG